MQQKRNAGQQRQHAGGSEHNECRGDVDSVQETLSSLDEVRFDEASLGGYYSREVGQDANRQLRQVLLARLRL